MLEPGRASFGRGSKPSVYLVVNSHDALARHLLGRSFTKLLDERQYLFVMHNDADVAAFEAAIGAVYNARREAFHAGTVEPHRIGRCLLELLRTGGGKTDLFGAFEAFWRGVTTDEEVFTLFFSKLRSWKRRGGTIPTFLKVTEEDEEPDELQTDDPPDHLISFSLPYDDDVELYINESSFFL